MTIQEKIRRDVYIITLDYFRRITEAIESAGDELPDETLADELLEYLHSQGVVIKAERELPDKWGEWDGDFKISSRLFDSNSEEAYNLAQQDMLRDGYVATEPLIKEVPK